ncbi:Uncharacterised protein [Acinetobacter baumannii]|nr:Uncharacterised protein [Acinetobacter baumannii]
MLLSYIPAQDFFAHSHVSGYLDANNPLQPNDLSNGDQENLKRNDAQALLPIHHPFVHGADDNAQLLHH